MTWPWQRHGRQRAAAEVTYTEAVVRQLLAAASGAAGADPGGLAVVQAAAALLGRVLGAARVEPANPRTVALTPQWLREAGRQLVLRGEAVHRIRVAEAGLMLDRAASWTVEGRGAWRYRLTLPAPSATVTTGLLPAAAVIHLRYHTSESQPWRGLSPVAASSTTAPLAARIEAMLSNEAGGPSGYLIPDETSGSAPPDLSALRGGSAMVPTQQQMRGAPGGAPRRDWLAARFGFAPPATVQPLRENLQTSILAAHGIPSALLEKASSGSDRRAAWSEYVSSEGRAVADAVAAELAAKLGEPALRLDLAGLLPREPLAQARMVRQLVDAGMDVAEARELAGL
jgi:hypothetical protein